MDTTFLAQSSSHAPEQAGCRVPRADCHIPEAAYARVETPVAMTDSMSSRAKGKRKAQDPPVGDNEAETLRKAPRSDHRQDDSVLSVNGGSASATDERQEAAEQGSESPPPLPDEPLPGEEGGDDSDDGPPPLPDEPVPGDQEGAEKANAERGSGDDASDDEEQPPLPDEEPPELEGPDAKGPGDAEPGHSWQASESALHKS